MSSTSTDASGGGSTSTSGGASSSIELPPSPNWYQSAICSATAACGGLLAFGAKNSVLVLAVGESARSDASGDAGAPGEQASPPAGACAARIAGSLAGHSDRISGVAFVADPTSTQLAHLLVSVGNDGEVRLWDARPEAMLSLGKLGSHDQAATAVACSPFAGGSDVVLSVGRDGTLRVWSIKSKAMRSSWRPLTATGGPVWPCALALPPVCPRTAAVGYHSGVVCIVDFESSTLLQKLPGHEEQIQSLAFCPQLGTNGASGLGGSVLVSAAKDRAIRLWKAERAGSSAQEGDELLWRCAETLTVPKPPSGSLTPQQKTRLWISCCWTFHGEQGWVLCTTGYVGELHVWPPMADSDGAGAASARQPLPITGGHSRPIFGISSLPAAPSAADGASKAAGSNLILTVSMDRTIGCWDVDAQQCRWNIPSLGGFVYRIKFAPSDPYRMALAVGDKSIRVWRRPKASGAGGAGKKQGEYDVSFLWKGVREKVTALCWHPTDETKIAFGLDDGAVGIYSLAGGSGAEGHSYKMFDGQHRGTVFVLAWPVGPDSDDSEADPPLYSAGADGRAFRWLNKRSVNVDKLISSDGKRLHEQETNEEPATRRSSIAFSADAQKVALGNVDGSIEVYLTNQPAEKKGAQSGWRLIRVYHEHSALVYTMAWGQPSEEWPEEKEWLASGSEDCTVRVHDTKDAARLSGAASEQTDQSNPFRRAAPAETDRLALLRGHTRAITELAWSPHTRGLLASSCLDGTTQVWQVAEKRSSAVANMRGHEGRVLCVAWSPLEPNVLHSGADDQTVRRWNAQSQPHSNPPARKKSTKKPAKGGGGGGAGGSAAKPSADDPSSPAMPPAPAPNGGGGARQRKARAKKGKPKGILSELAGMESSGANETAQKSCAHLAAQVLSTQPQELKPSHEMSSRDYLLFGGIASAVDTVDSEVAALSEKAGQSTSTDSVESSAILEMWRGNIGAALNLVATSASDSKEAAQPVNLSTWTALSVLGGREMWLSMMAVQGQALISKGDIHAGVLHLLAAEQTTAAVGTYREAGMYQEALTLAKLRLGDDDPVVSELYVEYAATLEKKRDFTTATKCYLAAGLPQKAVQTLTRRGDVSAYKEAYEISCMAAEGGDHSLAALCGCECQALGEWQAAASYYSQHDALKPYLLYLSAEESFRSAAPAVEFYTRVTSTWERHGVVAAGEKSISIAAFRATVWTYDRRLKSPIGQALLRLAEHTLLTADGGTDESWQQDFAVCTEQDESSGMGADDLSRLKEIFECQSLQ